MSAETRWPWTFDEVRAFAIQAACTSENRPDLLAMYRKEHPDFLGNLYNPDHTKARPLWGELNRHFPPKR